MKGSTVPAEEGRMALPYHGKKDEGGGGKREILLRWRKASLAWDDEESGRSYLA